MTKPPKRSGIRFQVDGTAERALRHLGAKPRPKRDFRYVPKSALTEDHHTNLALDDLYRAKAMIPIREAELADATAALAVTPDDSDGGNRKEYCFKANAKFRLANAAHNLVLAKKAVPICLSKLQTRINPVTGKQMTGAQGRAPHWSEVTPEQYLTAEQAARRVYDAALAMIATGEELEDVGSHRAFRRMRFPYYIDSPRHDEDQRRSISGTDIKAVPDEVLAFVLYVHREASKSGIPVLTRIAGWRVTIEHAIWRNSLPAADYELIAEFVTSAARRLHLAVHFSRPSDFTVISRTDSLMDYKHIIRALRETHWNEFTATDEKLFEFAAAEATATVIDGNTVFGRPLIEESDNYADHRLDFTYTGKWSSRDREAYRRFLNGEGPQLQSDQPAVEARAWKDPMPRLSGVGLPWALMNLFRLVDGHFDRVPPVRLETRSHGPWWYTPAGSYQASTEQIAGELADAVLTGDLDLVVWWHTKMLKGIDDSIVAKATRLAGDYILATIQLGPGRLRIPIGSAELSDRMVALLARVAVPIIGTPLCDLAARATEGRVPPPRDVVADLYVAAVLHDPERCAWIEYFYLSPLSDRHRAWVFTEVEASIDRRNRREGGEGDR